MSIGIIATVLSSLSLAIMVLFDRLMVADCYDSNARHAWLVSSAAGAGFGLILTVVVWLLVSVAGAVELATLFTILTEHIVLGLIMLLAGALSVQVLYHYFQCFGGEARSAAIAAWLAATPLIIFAVLASLHIIVTATPILPQAADWFSEITLTPVYFVGLLIATVGLVSFELLDYRPSEQVAEYRAQLALMLGANVLYNIIIHLALQTTHITLAQPEWVISLALLPYYWVGFAAGIRVVRIPGVWTDFKRAYREKIRRYLPVIIGVEVIGMFVFFFEFFGLGELDPAYVAMVIGAHIVIVYITNYALGNVRANQERRQRETTNVLGLIVATESLPDTTTDDVLKEIIFLSLAIAGIVIATLAVF